MSIKLVRDALRDSFKEAKRAGEKAKRPHAGLLLQCGYLEDQSAKSEHIESVCQAFDCEFHERAYQRWCKHTSDSSQFRSFSLALESRLLIGLSGGGLMETGCVISHSHGAPYLPGSGIKGVVAAYARELLCGLNREDLADEVFGAPPNDDWPEGRSGLVAFHDAWWKPKSAEQPFVAEIITSHHSHYYSPKDRREPPSDFDSPVPNAQIAVQGAFRFTLAGPAEWLDLAEEMTISALTERGLGARTRSGYGYFSDVKAEPDLPASPWIDEQIKRIRSEPGGSNQQEDEILRSKGLAKMWQQIDDSRTKHEAFLAIRTYWQSKGWWNQPPRGKSAKQAKAIYDDYDPD